MNQFFRYLRWRRRPIGVIMLALGLLLAAQSLVNRAQGDIEIVIATKNVAAGVALTSDDLGVQRVPSRLVPTSAYRDLAELVGKTIAVPIVARQIMVPGLVVAGEAASSGKAIVPIPISSQLKSVLYVGAKVDLTSSVKNSNPRVIAENALIAALPESNSSRFGIGGGQVALVQIPKELVAVVTQATTHGQVGVALR